MGSSPTDARPSMLAMDLRNTSVGLSTCSDSPLPPGKSGPGVPRRHASRILLTYLALVPVIGQTGIYRTLESPLPLCSKSTAWMAASCQETLNWKQNGSRGWPVMTIEKYGDSQRQGLRHHEKGGHTKYQGKGETYYHNAKQQSHQGSPAEHAPSSGPTPNVGA